MNNWQSLCYSILLLSCYNFSYAEDNVQNNMQSQNLPKQISNNPKQKSIDSFLFSSGILSQIVSVHLGTTAFVGDTLSKHNIRIGMRFSAGASTGINFIRITDNLYMGARLRYLYHRDGDIDSHSAGLVGYIHPFMQTKIFGLRQFISFVYGGGWIYSRKERYKSHGAYLEAGISLFKYYNIINVDILYRANFYLPNNDFHSPVILNSLNVVFAFF